MPSARLTQRRIDTLKPRSRAYDVRDPGLKGFGVRILPSGSKRYFLHSQSDGKRIWHAIGDAAAINLDSARSRATALLAASQDGNADNPDPCDPILFETVADEVFQRYGRRWKPRCRSSKPHRPQKSWHFSPLPTTVCYMKTVVMILVAFVHEIVLSRATLQPGKRRSPPTSGGPEAGKTTAAASPPRPRVLGLAISPVATLEGRPCHRQARDGHRLAPPGVPPFLEMEVVPRKAGSPANLEGNT